MKMFKDFALGFAFCIAIVGSIAATWGAKFVASYPCSEDGTASSWGDGGAYVDFYTKNVGSYSVKTAVTTPAYLSEVTITYSTPTYKTTGATNNNRTVMLVTTFTATAANINAGKASAYRLLPEQSIKFRTSAAKSFYLLGEGTSFGVFTSTYVFPVSVSISRKED